MQLARDLGAGSYRKMLRTMASSELAEWMALYRIEAREAKEAQLKARAQSKAGAMSRGHRR